MPQVLDHGTPLLSSTGDEFQGLESDPEFQRMTPQVKFNVCVLLCCKIYHLAYQSNIGNIGYCHACNVFPQERLAIQRKQLEQRLGLSAQGKVFAVGMEQLFDDSDLMTPSHSSPKAGRENTKGNVCNNVQQ